MSDRLVVRVVGPLAPYASAFDQELRSRGYTKLSAAQQLRLMAHLSQWLVGAGLGAAELTPERVEAFCVTRRDEGYTGLRTAKALAPLQAFLHEQGVLFEPAVPTLVSAEDRLLERYRNYLVGCRRPGCSWLSIRDWWGMGLRSGPPGSARSVSASFQAEVCRRQRTWCYG